MSMGESSSIWKRELIDTAMVFAIDDGSSATDVGLEGSYNTRSSPRR
jgi:hypothetical protein